MRVGMGYDAHKLVKERSLVLGGVEIPFEKGLLGHSDADVLLHSICDALLGAAGEGDIGKHFPDSDPSYKGISSLKLLHHVKEVIYKKGFDIVNIDVTVVCQRPKLAPYIKNMIESISVTLDMPKDCLNIKATTTEGMGFTGNGEGISSYSVVLLESQPAGRH